MSFSVMLRFVKTNFAFKQIAMQYVTNTSFVFPLPKKQLLFGSPDLISLGHISIYAPVDEILSKPCLTKKSINLLVLLISIFCFIVGACTARPNKII